jgi:16S rRNA (guanine(966)-N(2))-methyltransferase RsmD
MRVIAGIYGSRKLQTLRGLALRPSSDRLRETLFNILGADVQDAIFLDLFAGSGAVGIEALSRGARKAFFVENHAAGAALLRRNLQTLGIAETAGSAPHAPSFAGTAEVITLRATAALDQLETRGVHADFVFADPPYADDTAYDRVLESLGDSELIAPGGRAIIEHQRRRKLPAVAGRLERTRVLEQGTSALTFYRVVLAA